jgi:hypothetical protein
VPKAPIAVVANKIDLEEALRQEEGQQFAGRINALFHETSANQGLASTSYSRKSAKWWLWRSRKESWQKSTLWRRR